MRRWLLVWLTVLLVAAPVSQASHTPETWTQVDKPRTPSNGPPAAAFVGDLFFLTEGPGRVASYDPFTNTWDASDWDQSTAFTEYRRDGAAVGVGDRLFYIGGRCQERDCSIELDMVESYDTTTGTWRTEPSMPTARADLGAGVIGDKIYVVGGFLNDTFPPNTAVLEIFDTTTGTWSTGPPMEVARWDVLTGVTEDDRLVVAGGICCGGNRLTDVEIFDPATNAWDRLTDLPVGMDGQFLGQCRGHLYASHNTQGHFRYTFATDSWEAFDEPPTVSGLFGASHRSGEFFIDRAEQIFSCTSTVFPIPEHATWLLGLVGLAAVGGFALVARRRGG